ncbi:MAG: hypothetical protein KAY50_01295 [Chitinophagaceae bacterium]|nr:hypothetical protein [Chitinophagaceae bacterium]
MNEFENKLEKYIDYYDLEKHLFLNGKIWARKGWLSKPEFLEICLWKSRRPKKLYEQNSEKKIIRITKKSFLEKDEIKKIEFLTELHGVSIPTASAILCIINPEDYPVIDVRCVESLQDINLITWEKINLTNWLDYLKIVREIAKKYNKSTREIEKGLFAFNRIKLDKEFRNLYK